MKLKTFLTLFLGVFLLSFNSFALDPTISKMGESEKSVLKKFYRGIGVDEKKYNLDELVKNTFIRVIDAFERKDWYAFWSTKGDLASEENLNLKEVSYGEMFIYSSKANFSFHAIYLPQKNIVRYIARDVRITTSDSALSIYKKYKNDSRYKIRFEDDRKAIFNKKGYFDYVVVRLNGNVGSVEYVNGGSIKLKKRGLIIEDYK